MFRVRLPLLGRLLIMSLVSGAVAADRPNIVIILADEPTGNLDPELSKEIMGLFEQFNQVGVSVLIATHDHELISRLGHRLLTLKQGKLERDGRTADLIGETVAVAAADAGAEL